MGSIIPYIYTKQPGFWSLLNSDLQIARGSPARYACLLHSTRELVWEVWVRLQAKSLAANNQ